MKIGAMVGSLAAATALVLAGCGNDDPTPLEEPAAGSAQESMNEEDTMSDEKSDKDADEKDQSTAEAANSVLPAVNVIDVATGGDVDLAGLVPSKTPILLWAWAPHCAICAGEAPGVEDFAAANGDTVEIVGLGTQDSLDLAEDFVATYGVQTPQMLWDPGFESWRSLKITGQPTWVLISPEGEELGRWQGGLPEQEILAAAG